MTGFVMHKERLLYVVSRKGPEESLEWKHDVIIVC